MLRKLLGVLLSVAFGAGLMACAYEFHVLRTAEGLEIVRKPSPDWHEAYVDVRGWSAREWAAHPRLAKNLALAKRLDIIDASDLVPPPPPWFKSTSWSRPREEPADDESSAVEEIDSSAPEEAASDEPLDNTGQPGFELETVPRGRDRQR
ncbi:MAG: hypothetical protein ACK50P_15850 [Planctomycetaceae bacterium]|jgi:hypothetical protein